MIRIVIDPRSQCLPMSGETPTACIAGFFQSRKLHRRFIGLNRGTSSKPFPLSVLARERSTSTFSARTFPLFLCFLSRAEGNTSKKIPPYDLPLTSRNLEIEVPTSPVISDAKTNKPT
jgi:hypothetical protein